MYNKLNYFPDFKNWGIIKKIEKGWLVEVSVPFSFGQIHRYFEGEPTLDFWNINAVYVAYTSLNSIIWAEKFGEEEIRGMKRRFITAFDDYDKFNATIPKWYKFNSNKYMNIK